MQSPLSLEELKAEAHQHNYLVIRGEKRSVWVPLKTWKGHPTGVTYYLMGNRVLAKSNVDDK